MARSKSEIKEKPIEVVAEKAKVEEAPTFEEKIIIPTFSNKQATKEKLARLIAEETKLVKGRFRNYEAPGGSLRVQIRKYPGIPAFDKVMLDNEMYEVPLYVARHLNGVDVSAGGGNHKINTCAWPTHGFKYDVDKPMPGSTQDDRGIPVPIIGVSKWNKRFGFESMEFDAAI